MLFSDPVEKVFTLKNSDFFKFIKIEFSVWRSIFDNLIPNSLVLDERYVVESEVFDEINATLMMFNAPGLDHDAILKRVVGFYEKYNLPIISECESIFGSLRNLKSVPEEFSIFVKVLIYNYIIDLPKRELLNFYNLGLVCKYDLSRSKTSRFDKKIDNLQNVFANVENQVNTRVEILQTNISSVEKKLQNEFGNFENTKNKIIDNYEADISAIKKAFDSEIKLRSAVNYWEAKRIKHTRAAKNIIASSIYCGTLAVFVVGVLIFLIFTFSNSVEKILLDKNFKYIISAFLITLVFWGIRLAVKIWLSNIHLANDAEERVVLVQTYLALQKDNVMPDNDDKKVVINSLFRQAADGVVKDDGMPNPVIELLTKNK